MSFDQSLVTSSDNNVEIVVPLVKIKPEKRTVIGIATSDAEDHAGDVVTWKASKKAFQETQAKIREQHDAKRGPVGNIVAFEAKTIWDEKLEKVVNVIEVEAYISKTAEDTWTKINEGLLTGFSIGGLVRGSEERLVKDSKNANKHRKVKYITDYVLSELSICDNPCNPQSTILSIKKSIDGETVLDGMAAEVETMNVFWNAETKEFRESKEDAIAGYENIGWIETSKSLDDDVRSEQLASLFQAHNQSLVKSNEGGVTNMSEENQEVTAEEVVETPVVTTEEVVEEAPVVEEVDSEGTDIQKVLEDLRATIAETVEKAVTQSTEQTTESLAIVNDKLEKAATDFGTELTSLKSHQDDLSTKVSALSERFDSLQKSIDALESDSAIKKSGDLGGSKETIQKSNTPDWGGSFVSVRDL